MFRASFFPNADELIYTSTFHKTSTLDAIKPFEEKRCESLCDVNREEIAELGYSCSRSLLEQTVFDELPSTATFSGKNGQSITNVMFRNYVILSRKIAPHAYDLPSPRPRNALSPKVAKFSMRLVRTNGCSYVFIFPKKGSPSRAVIGDGTENDTDGQGGTENGMDEEYGTQNGMGGQDGTENGMTISY